MTNPAQRALDASLNRTLRRFGAVGAAAALLLAIVGPPTAIAAGRPTLGHQSSVKITRVHQTHMAKTTGTDVANTADPETGPREEAAVGAKAPGSQQAKRVPASHVPTPAGLAVTGAARPGGFRRPTPLRHRP